ncbi:MAG: NlpC/P60 family protein [Methylacidiphilaceae bacterium]|nr:NlpC/P60 family protein [Candidatus Methylacidiphilaceae bacterium]
MRPYPLRFALLLVLALAAAKAEPAPPPPAPAAANRGSQASATRNLVLQEIRRLAALRIGYGTRWLPEGSSRPWVMDCSNTVRYLFLRLAGEDLGRTASDQFCRLREKGLLWSIPSDSRGQPDPRYLRTHLRPGDLLFWENTYRPERDPPITHVMIFLERTTRGRWLMAGSEPNRGLYNPRGCGPDVRLFDPFRSMGGYHRGFAYVPARLVAHGRLVGDSRPR